MTQGNREDYYASRPRALEFKPVWRNGTYMMNGRGGFLPEDYAWQCDIRSDNCVHFGGMQRLPGGDTLAVCGFGTPSEPPSPDLGITWMMQILAPNCSVKWELVNPFPLQIQGIQNASSVPTYVQSYLSMASGGSRAWYGLFYAHIYAPSYRGLRSYLEKGYTYGSEENCRAYTEKHISAGKFNYTKEEMMKFLAPALKHNQLTAWPDTNDDN
ncbi:hypothetical protein CYMTET_50069 [Cymbomonas tetramitiformis]|uniref:Uncharacterized protein n=1 Tax=Cymbomonas tetramitiformis TaxID=36881 RepID=A0AAE0BQ31_9CHLO|nr:hypothetical protein CYMTET_50069 [Cymbomonas tetramitiformis]